MMLMKSLMIISFQVSGFIKKKPIQIPVLKKMFTTGKTLRKTITESTEQTSNRYNYLN